MNIKRYAAIDIGSNAMRLLVNTVTQSANYKPHFEKTALYRVPIRLGEDVFTKGEVSEEKIERMLKAMTAFEHLMEVHEIDDYKACATSAMREAENGEEIIARVKDQASLEIEIIDGKHEAAFIAATDLRQLIKSERTYLYVDVGGGSTELTVFSKGKTVASKSFNLGTVRLIHDLVKENIWDEVKKWIHQNMAGFENVEMIGSGGNINHIYRNSGEKRGRPLNYQYLKAYYKQVKSFTYAQRINRMNMKLDRADVIVPATKIYLSTMKWSGAENIYVPKIGLSDGIIKYLYQKDKIK